MKAGLSDISVSGLNSIDQIDPLPSIEHYLSICLAGIDDREYEEVSLEIGYMNME